ncbi:MAG TPA: prepilin-type N-terminal cleavage/methylation domain-containing protein [Opitutaceae bacterium]|nr:prepilin-type N-terminal cleavage/methylation domain-containing protein [Opitutaceae bacterium]
MTPRARFFPAAWRLASRDAGFTLLEVVVALGIFAVGMIAVVALFAPVARSVSDSADAEAATNIAGVLGDYLQRQTLVAHNFTLVAPLLKVSTAKSHQLIDADNNPNNTANDPRVDTQLLFASRDGTKIGGYTDQVWNDLVTHQPSDAEKFFEIALIRNETLSPNDPAADQNAIVLAYTARIRWPAFVPDATPTNSRRALPAGFNPTGAVRFDHSQQQALFVAGSVRR